MKLRKKFIDFLRWSEKYTGTDMVYAVKGSFWVALGKTGIFTIAFFKMLVFGRFAPLEVYGIYSYILAMVYTFGIFALPGINTSLVKAIAQKKEGTLFLAVKEKLKWSLVGAGGMLLLAFWYLMKRNYILGPAFFICAIFLPFVSSFTIFSAFWMGRKRFDTQSKYDVGSIFLIEVVVILVIIFTNNVFLIILSLLVSQTTFNGIFLQKTLKKTINKEKDYQSIAFGKNLTVLGVVSLLSAQIDKIIIWKFLGPVSVAIYSFAQFPITKIKSIIPITHLALPKLGERNIKEIKKGIIQKFKKLFFFVVPVVFLIILIAPFLYQIFFPKYLDSVPYFQALALTLLFAPFLLLGASFVAEIKKKELYIIQTVTPFLKIILFFALIPFWGIWGIVASILISKVSGDLLSLYFFKKI